MLSISLVVPGQSVSGPSSSTGAHQVYAPRPSVPPSPVAPRPGARFYSYGLLCVVVVLLAAYAVVSYVGPHSAVEVPLGLFALLFAPGYAVAAPLFVRQPGLPWTVNLPITVGLSVVINVFVGIALLEVGTGLSTIDTAAADLGIALVGLIAFIARESIEAPSGPSSTVTQDLSGPLRALSQRLRWGGYSRGQRWVGATLLVLILVVFGFIVYVAVAEPHKVQAVSFAIYGPSGTVLSLPSNGTNTSVLAVVLTVTNNATPHGFQLAVLSELVAHPNTPPTTISWSQPLPLGRATESVLAFSLGAGRSTTLPVSFVLFAPGTTPEVNSTTLRYSLYTVSFTLESATGIQIRSLELPLNITSED
jgi:hypothetical protein